jgi:hypothetical protein
VPSTQSLSNRSLATDPLISGAKGAPRSCPAGSIAEVGLCVARRLLQLSLFAMLSVLAVESQISSSSQRRPRAIEAISVARFSERIGRRIRKLAPAGKSISRRRVEFAFCHGT